MSTGFCRVFEPSCIFITALYIFPEAMGRYGLSRIEPSHDVPETNYTAL